MNKKTAKNASPKSWRAVKLGELAEIITGKTPPTKNKELYGDKYPFITPTDINEASRFCKPSRYLSEQGKNSQISSMLPENSVCYTCIASIGKMCITTEDSFTNQQINALKVYAEIAETLYIFYCLKYLTPKIISIAGGTANKIVNKSLFSSIEISIPPLAEQRAIASLLEKWDMATEKIEALIVAKEKQFKGLLKTLIGDQQNNSEWRKLKLGEVCKINKGEQLGRLQMIKNGKYSVQNGGISPSGNTDKWNTPANTVTISEGGNSCGYVNLMTSKFWAGGHCYTLANLIKGIDVGFLYYILKERERFLMRLRVGSALPNIQKGDIENFSLFFPSLVVQRQINRILNAGSREIVLLRQLVQQYREQRDGLARKLLMGEWRVQT